MTFEAYLLKCDHFEKSVQKLKCKNHYSPCYGFYVLDYFLARHSNFLKTTPVAWQPYSDEKTE